MSNNPSFRGSIFISYRRADSPGYVRGLMSEMRNTFGSNQVFLDMEDIAVGNDFPQIIEEAVSNCELLLAIIGPSWFELRNEIGQRRIDEPSDFVRLEIRAAFDRQIPVIPVMVENASFPKVEELPEDLKLLSTLQGIVLSHERWDEDVARLFSAIEKVTIEPQVARLYSSAMSKLDRGHWQEALADFETVASMQANYLDVPERIEPLRTLANRLSQLGPKGSRWQQWASRYPLILMVIVCLLPNVIAAVFNFFFNWETIVLPMVNRGFKEAAQNFEYYALFVNSVGFLVGIVVFVFLAKPLSRGLADQMRAIEIPPQTLVFLRRRCLMLGQAVALIGAVLWISAGPIYPLMMGALEVNDYIYFTASLTICGLFVATYPFLLVTWLSTHVYYLTFILPGTISAEDELMLNSIDRWRWRYLAMAGAMPMLLLALGLVLSASVKSHKAILLLGIFGIVGVVGFILALRLFQAIQSDIILLKQAVSACRLKVKHQNKIRS
jgi:TIR domain